MQQKGLRRLTVPLVALVAAISGFAAESHAGSWWETTNLKGDLRYRHEMIDTEGKDARHRHRIRARVGIFGEASPYTKVGIQLATGSDDPVSTNQSLDDAFTTKSIGVDLAYFEASHEKVPGLTLTGGKFANPFFTAGHSELLWDSDWNPEGGALTFAQDLNNRISLNMIGAGLWIDERSSDDDSYMIAGQGVASIKLDEEKSAVAVGAGFFNYVNTRGFEVFYDPEDPKGNSAVTPGEGETGYHYAADFEIVEFFGEATHKFEIFPVTLMGDLVINTAADSLETGWLVGLRIGKAKKTGSWEGRYIYRRVEKDAVIGIFTDSDFRGGGTDACGHELGGAVQLAQNTAFNVTYFVNDIGLQREDKARFTRLQIDLQLKF
jgi:hypothetical protein